MSRERYRVVGIKTWQKREVVKGRCLINFAVLQNAASTFITLQTIIKFYITYNSFGARFVCFVYNAMTCEIGSMGHWTGRQILGCLVTLSL